MRRRELQRARLAALLAVATAACAAAPALAAPPRRAFDIPAAPLATALTRFAVQANVSISIDEARRCRALGNRVVGAFDLAEALRRLLEGTGCSFRMVDATTIRIVRAPPPPAPAPPSAPPPLPPPPPPQTLGEVVVTATRRAALADSLPFSVTTFPQDRLSQARAADAADLTGQTAGLTVTNLGPGRDKIMIRGLSDGALTGRTQATVGIYLDDVRITYNAPDPDLRLTDIDRVEVLRGPQGALYGAGSIGGIYRIVTRPPELDRFGGEVSATAAATRGGRPSTVVEGVANLPLARDRLALRIVGYRESDGGYIDDLALGLKDVNRTIRSGVRVSLRLRLGDNWTASAGLTRQGVSSDDTQYALAGLAPLQRALHLQEPHDNDFTQAFVTLAGETPAGRLKNAFSLVRHDLRSRYDATDALPFFVPLQGPPSAFDDEQKIEMLVDEVSLTSPGTGPVQWLAGAFYAGGEQDLGSTLSASLAAGAAPTVVYHEERTDLIHEAALYGEVSYALTPRLTLAGGARAFLVRVATTSTVKPGGDAASFHGRLTSTGLAPQVSLRFQITEATLAYVQASEGYRAGGFNTAGPIGQAFAETGDGAQPHRRFGGDELWSFEAGLKTRLLEDRLSLRVTGFSAVWNNIQSDQLLPSGLPFTANIGDGRNIGLEFEGAYALGPLLVRANGLVDSPELTRRDPSFPAVSDSGLAGAPRLSGGVSLRYARRLGGGLTGVLEAQYAYVGASTLTFDAQTAPRMGGYGAGKLTATLDAGTWRASLFVDNPADTRANTFAYGNPFTLRRTTQITPQRPRTVGLVVSRDF